MGIQIKNFSMDVFNNDVNHSGNLEDKYTRWSAYRAQINEFLSSFLSKDVSQTLLVMGAGECNDLDLKFLARSFSTVTLTDIDADSINEGVARQRLTKDEQSRIAVRALDYTGLQQAGFFESLAKQTSQGAPISHITNIVSQTCKSVKPILTFETADKFDMVLSCPIYTQLAITQIEVLAKIMRSYQLYSEKDVNMLLSAANDGMPFILKNYNNLMLRTLKKSSIIAVLSDVVEIPSGDKVLAQIQSLLKETPTDTNPLENFVSEFGLEWSVLGLDDLKQKLNPIANHWILWPFDSSKEYLVYGYAGKR